MNPNVIYPKGTPNRPAYVPAEFFGCCKVFPLPLADGAEPRFLSYQSSWVTDPGLMLLAEKVPSGGLDLGQCLLHRPRPLP